MLVGIEPTRHSWINTYDQFASTIETFGLTPTNYPARIPLRAAHYTWSKPTALYVVKASPLLEPDIHCIGPDRAQVMRRARLIEALPFATGIACVGCVATFLYFMNR